MSIMIKEEKKRKDVKMKNHDKIKITLKKRRTQKKNTSKDEWVRRRRGRIGKIRR